jgi:hypothetical protein
MPKKKDQDSSPGKKLLRLYKKLLLEGKKHYLSDLAVWLNCSPQTIIRLMTEIDAEAGLQLETGLDNHRRWYRMKTVSGERFGLQFEEVRYLALCRDLACQILPEPVIRRIDNSLLRLSLAISEENCVVDKNKTGHLMFFNKGRIDYGPHQETITKLMNAQEKKRVCRVKYKASGKFTEEPKEHLFAVGRIIALNNALYVLGASLNDDHSFKFWTNLAVHRIQSVEPANKEYNFKIPDPDPNTFGFPYHEPKTFRIHFHPGKPADYVRERVWAEEQRIEELDDGGLFLTIATRSEQELMAWVRSFGEHCEVV